MKPHEVAEAVGRGDVVKLASVPGLGSKTAERLVLELRGKNLAAFDPGIAGGSEAAGGPYVEAREALAALGYSLEEAEKALKEVPPQDTVQRYVREALRRMGGSRR
jgi:Holliday junction DNA helicase RuvA